MTEDYDKYSNYYFEKYTKTHVIFYGNHDYIQEKNLWKKLHDKKILKLFQRTKSQAATEKPKKPWRTENVGYAVKNPEQTSVFKEKFSETRKENVIIQNVFDRSTSPLKVEGSLSARRLLDRIPVWGPFLVELACLIFSVQVNW